MFLDFWGEKRSLNRMLSQLHSMSKCKGKATSSFNRGFASFYYDMPREINPLEGAMKLHYAYFFPLDLSLFLLDRESYLLHNMFADVLEVEENIRISGRFPYQGGNIENDEDLK